MHKFDYRVPGSLNELLSLKAESRRSSNLLAGGTDLIVLMRAGRKLPELVIDVKKVPELTRLSLDETELLLGAAITCRNVYENSLIADKFTALAEATKLIGGIQIQGRATVGGNLCNAAPSADTIPVLIVYGATASIASIDGRRDVPIEDFCLGPGKSCLDDSEILSHIIMPVPPSHSATVFLRFTPRNEMDIAVANVAVAVELDDTGNVFKSVRIAIGAVAPTPLLIKGAGSALEGRSVSDETIRQAAQLAKDAATPITDMRGTIEHRLQLVEVLTSRALKGAIKCAKENTL